VGNGVEVEFFGERTTLPAGPATIALRTGATLVAAVVYSGPGRDHTGVISPPFDTTRTGSLRHDVTRLTQEIATQLEAFIRRAPEQWHMFQPNWPSDPPLSERSEGSPRRVPMVGSLPSPGGARVAG
jgi:lauroyl/myristoyl acyltransferase